jgi:hypothetical protein
MIACDRSNINISKICLYTSAASTLASGVAIVASAPLAVVAGIVAVAAVALRAYFVFRYFPLMELKIFDVKRVDDYCWTFKLGNPLIGNTSIEFNINSPMYWVVEQKMKAHHGISACAYYPKNGTCDCRTQILEDPVRASASNVQPKSPRIPPRLTNI